MAHARLIRLRIRGVSGPSRLEGRGRGHFLPAHHLFARLRISAGGDPWHYHLALFVLLAGLDGSRRPARQASRENCQAGALFAASRIDVVTGAVYSNAIMYFIILTTAATLHAHGLTDITTAKQAAEALLPLAGRGAYLLFALGLIGTGMLGVPVLAGSCAYAFRKPRPGVGCWTRRRVVRRSSMPLSLRPSAPACCSTLLALNAVKMLFWSAVMNGVLAPPLILLVILLTSSSKVMGSAVSPPLLRWLGWATFVFMSAAAVALFVL